MALHVFELFGYASDKAAHEDAIKDKIADGWTFHPPVTITTEGQDCKTCATFTKDVQEDPPEMTDVMHKTTGRKKAKRKR